MNDAERLIADYRERLTQATSDLPAGHRAELLSDIDTHLSEAVSQAPDEASVLQMLDDLGTPESIADAAREEAGVLPRGRTDGSLFYDVLSVLVLSLGGFVVPVVGWIAGVIMIWNGPRWTMTDRWAGTLAWPAAIAPPFAFLFATHAIPQFSPAPAWILLTGLFSIVLLVVPMVHLLRVAARRRSPDDRHPVKP
ncbi:HAAS signaling domain-containing protein [Nesterenkonia sandarakina]|uniref:DUF1700 domain-containing protein n=1 Tax=Nesterenkonia sandarakina TaxID=272918 RepID=A0A7Z0EC17_9MICC|nr:hypothetical protein [Nesterenkonia sandarakina]NYJ18152.1 hypothetical protein [Nesterenkonia sandarakina]